MPNSEINQRLVRQQRLEALNHLAAGVAHEFNNVLQIVRGYVAFAREASPQDSAARADLDNALLATDRAADLSARMLQFARAEDDRGGTADAADALRSVASLLAPTLGEHIRVEVDVPSDLPFAAVSESLLRQAILNLCVNARDAMPAGGTLRLSARLESGVGPEGVHVGSLVDSDYVTVAVEDTGEGMSAGVIEHAFEPFYTTKAPGEGTGLGLAMLAGFVAGAGGGVRVTSVEGVGSRFLLYLPLIEESVVGKESAPMPSTTAATDVDPGKREGAAPPAPALGFDGHVAEVLQR